MRIAIKPTSSILTSRKSINRDNKNVEVITKGRHDPCVGIRGVPVAEAMMSLVLADLLMRHKAQCGFGDYSISEININSEKKPTQQWET